MNKRSDFFIDSKKYLFDKDLIHLMVLTYLRYEKPFLFHLFVFGDARF